MRAGHWMTREKKKPRLDWLMSNMHFSTFPKATPLALFRLCSEWANGWRGSSSAILPTHARSPAGWSASRACPPLAWTHDATNPFQVFLYQSEGRGMEDLTWNDPSSSAFSQRQWWWCSMVASFFFCSFKFPSFLHFGYDVITTRRSEWEKGNAGEGRGGVCTVHDE